ncbi:transcription factor with AP2 domain(s), putative [Plasmodium ovale wallikeri]|uniref:Transcription factor with AP2 domain(S), putative n=2 Tax=Plasmodium ovale TaxID=36330 RepID=A0A1A9A1E2_PLAOA|nr:transcription factor with AP2 domain(s), putative [Plasmodium ovale wallikeri]SBT50340.1 transcription factor with AP2 domain(s), putative [Plasmodium ovale wallikeri]SBT82722.1 transcription factor with AP2 domain(s), putative [Plasmodium ovale]
MNDDMCAKEKLSKVEKLRKKKEGYNVSENCKLSKNEHFEHEENLRYSKFCEHNNNAYDSYDLVNMPSTNRISDDEVKPSSISGRTISSAYAYVDDMRNISDSINSTNSNCNSILYGNQSQAQNVEGSYKGASKDDQTNFNAGLNIPLMKLLSMRCSTNVDLGNNTNCDSVSSKSIFKQGFERDSISKVNSAYTVHGENIDEECDDKKDTMRSTTVMNQIKQNSEENEGKCEQSNNTIDSPRFADTFSGEYQKSSVVYQQKEGNILSTVMDSKNMYDCSNTFDKALTRKKKKLSKDNEDDELNVSYGKIDHANRMMQNMNMFSMNGKKCINMVTSESDDISSENENILSNDIAKKFFDNMDLLHSLNKNADNDNAKSEQLSKFNSMNYVKNVLSDMSNMHSGIGNSHNNAGRIIGNMINSSEETNTINEQDSYINLVNMDRKNLKDSQNYLYSSDYLGIHSAKLGSKRSNKKGAVLSTKNNENVITPHDTFTHNTYTGMNKDSCDMSLYNNGSSRSGVIQNGVAPNEVMQDGMSNKIVYRKQPSNDMHGETLKSAECMKINSSLGGYDYDYDYDYCNFSLNNFPNSGIELIKSQKKFMNTKCENNMAPNSSSSNVCNINNKKASNSKLEMKDNAEFYANVDDDSYKKKTINDKFINVNKTNEDMDNSPNYAIPMVLKTSKDLGSSVKKNISSSVDVITNTCGMSQSNNLSERKNINSGDMKMSGKLINMNHHNRGNNTYENAGESSSNYGNTFDKENFLLTCNQEDIDNFRIMNNSDGLMTGDTLLYNTQEMKHKEKLKNVCYNDVFSSRMKKIPEEQFRYLSKKEESFSSHSFCPDVNIVAANSGTNVVGEALLGNPKRRNQSIDFQTHRSFSCDEERAENDDFVDKVRRYQSFEAHEEFGEKENELDMYNVLRGGGAPFISTAPSDIRTSYKSDNYCNKNETDVEEEYEDAPLVCERIQSNNNERVSEQREIASEHAGDEEIKEASNNDRKFFTEWNESFRGEIAGAKRKTKNSAKLKISKNDNTRSKKDINNVESSIISKDKNNYISQYYDDLNKALFNIKNNANIDELTKKKLLSRIESSFFPGKNPNMHFSNEEHDEQAQSSAVHANYMKQGRTNAAQEVHRGANNASHSGMRSTEHGQDCDPFGNCSDYDNSKRSRKCDLKPARSSVRSEKAPRDIKMEKHREYLYRNSFSSMGTSTSAVPNVIASANSCSSANAQLMMGKQCEQGFLNNYNYAHEGNRICEVGVNEDAKVFAVKERKNKKQKKIMNVLGEKNRADDMLQQGVGVNEKYDTHDNCMNEEFYNDISNENNTNEVICVGEFNNRTMNNAGMEKFQMNILNPPFKKKGKVNLSCGDDMNDELRKIIISKNELTKALEQNDRNIIENVEGRMFMYSSNSNNSNNNNSIGKSTSDVWKKGSNCDPMLRKGKLIMDEGSSRNFSIMKDELNASMDTKKLPYKKNREVMEEEEEEEEEVEEEEEEDGEEEEEDEEEEDEEEDKLVNVRNCYEENADMGINGKKYDSDDLKSRKFGEVQNNEKKQKLCMSDVMKSNELQNNDSYFKFHSNLPSNLLSTSTSSSYSNDNLKVSSANYSMNELSSNACTNKYYTEESMPSNLNANTQINKNNNRSYEKKKKKNDKKYVTSSFNSATNYVSNVNYANGKITDNDANVDGFCQGQKGKGQHLLNVLHRMDAESKVIPNGILIDECVKKELINSSQNQFIMKNRHLGEKQKQNQKQREREKEEEETEETEETDEADGADEAGEADEVDEKEDVKHAHHENVCSTGMSNNSHFGYHLGDSNLHDNSKKVVWGNANEMNGVDVRRCYEDKFVENSQSNYAKSDVQFRKNNLQKSKSHSENDKLLNMYLKRKMSVFSDYAESDENNLKKHKFYNNYGKEDNEFLLSRTNSLNINMSRMKKEQLLDCENEANSNLNNENSGNKQVGGGRLYDSLVRVKGEQEMLSNITDSSKLLEEKFDLQKGSRNQFDDNKIGTQVKGEKVVGEKGEKPNEPGNDTSNRLENETSNGLENETSNGIENETSNGLENDTSNGLENDTSNDTSNETSNEASNAGGGTVKNEIDISVCTLANCPTHNPQSYTRNVSRRGDSQGEGGMVKEENDELKRIPGVYYDKNSQRWFGEHKINGVKCAQSFAVKKHGCEEAKRLAIEWKKARIRGEVWDRFINKKKKSNNNSSCINKTNKTSRPSVEELRIKYLSMSKNMPKVRGVWFNSTPQRMGWVGQAYKKCKRIERIFSVNKYGFEGARKLAIAFRNSQKPSNEDSDEDSWSKDDKGNIKNGDENLNSYEYKTGYSSCMTRTKSSHDDMNDANDMNDTNDGNDVNDINDTNDSNDNNDSHYGNDDNDGNDGRYNNENSYSRRMSNNMNKIENKDTRINLCRDAILFILHDLETILELNIPMLNKNVNIYKICIKHHLNYLTLIKSEEQIIPYLNVFGDYIQRCILPTDLPYAELYVLIDSLIHNDILPSFDHKENFAECSVAEDPGIITPSMLL